MQLSFEKGDPIAFIEGGKDNNKIIYLHDPSKKCCDKCSEKCGQRGRYCCEKCVGDGGCLTCGGNLDDEIDDEEVINKIKRRGIKANNPHKRNIKTGKEIIINDEGIIRILPNFDTSERSYTCGPSGSGKSYWISKYIEQWKRIFKREPIYIFSDVDKDELLDKYNNVRRVRLTEELINNPLDAKEFPEGSLIIFDDIDSIINKKLMKAIEDLRDHLLDRGRHEKLYVIVSNHLMTDHKRTRVCLNECSVINVFPRSGSAYGITYLLKHYCGLAPKQIKTLMNLQSRWVTVKKNYPLHVIHEKGVYLI